MKPTTGPAVGVKSLQVLQKSRRQQAAAKPASWAAADGAAAGKKVDRVKEYMEQKFFEQFLPKRDAHSRIRKLSLDKDTLRRARGIRKNSIPNSNELTAAAAAGKAKNKETHAAPKKPQKAKCKRPHAKPPKEICALVSTKTSSRFAAKELFSSYLRSSFFYPRPLTFSPGRKSLKAAAFRRRCLQVGSRDEGQINLNARRRRLSRKEEEEEEEVEAEENEKGRGRSRRQKGKERNRAEEGPQWICFFQR
ncbi:hypothetical protein Efla_006734 [Eimeria flavescens]